MHPLSRSARRILVLVSGSFVVSVLFTLMVITTHAAPDMYYLSIFVLLLYILVLYLIYKTPKHYKSVWLNILFILLLLLIHLYMYTTIYKITASISYAQK